MTPASAYCTLRCNFCWRVQSKDLGLMFDETILPACDDPTFIVNEAFMAQSRILSGYKAHPHLLKDRFSEAKTPAHAAISLAGEPTLYPKLGALIEEFRRRGLTTFLVTNGTQPDVLSVLDHEPSQLYVSVCAPEEDVFLQACRPSISKAWQQLLGTLDLMKSFSCPTVIRLTLVKDLNMLSSESYGKLILKANPTYVEAKAYVHVGMSRLRLGFENMPTHREIVEFSRELSEATGYKIIDESTASRVVLLSRLERPKRIA